VDRVTDSTVKLASRLNSANVVTLVLYPAKVFDTTLDLIVPHETSKANNTDESSHVSHAPSGPLLSGEGG